MKDMVFKPMPVTMVEVRHLKSRHIRGNGHEGCSPHEDQAAKLVAMDGREKDLIKFGNLNIIY